MGQLPDFRQITGIPRLQRPLGRRQRDPLAIAGSNQPL